MDFFSNPRTVKGAIYLDLTLGNGVMPNLVYTVQASNTLKENDWRNASIYIPTVGWSGTAPVIVSPTEGPATSLRITDTGTPSPDGSRFYRLKVELTF